GTEIVYWDAAINKQKAEVKEKFNCPTCSSEITKRNVEKAYESWYDNSISQVVRMVKQVPVFINYSIGKKRHEKRPSDLDLEVVSKIGKEPYLYKFPTTKIEDGAKTREPLAFGA